MKSELLLRIICLCVALASAETLHGIARTLYLAPRIGKARAVKVSIISGSVLAFGVCYFLVPATGLQSPSSLVALGLVISLFMASFDIAMGLLVLRRSWHQALSDLNPKTGNYLLFGLLLLVSFPLLVGQIRGT